MKIERLIVGSYEENCYILKTDNECLIIDPGADFSLIDQKIKDYKLLGILITHHHFDHIGALNELKEKYNVVVYEFPNLKEDLYVVGPFKFKVIYTPGHTSDSVTYYFEQEKIMFTGDFLFHGDVGRCDLPTGNFDIMKESIAKIKGYNNDIIIYPGHEEETILGNEKLNNPYF